MFFYKSPLEQFDNINIFNIYIDFYNIFFELSITNIIIPLLIIFIILKFIINNFIKFIILFPNSLQFFFEQMFLFIFNIIKQQIGQKGLVYLPVLFTLFYFILFSNLLSMFPFSFTLTSYINIIFFLSLSIGIATFLIGLKFNKLNLFSLFIPECPFILLPLLIIIEIFSYVIRWFSLAIRLSANIMAGHTLIFIISSFILKMSNFSSWFLIIFGGFILIILILELGIAILQAYVFLILISIYLCDSIYLNH